MKNTIRKKRTLAGTTDTTLVFTILFLIVFGIIMIYSSSYYASYETYGNHIEYLKKQTVWAVIGVMGMYLVSKIDYRFILKFWLIAYLSSLVLLVLVLFIGQEINGAKRWLDFKVIGFQPSEVAKLAIIMTLAVSIYHTQKYLGKFRIFIMNAAILVAPVALIGIENMSTAIVAFIIGAAMIFIAMPNIKSILLYFGIPLGGGIAAAAAYIGYNLSTSDNFRMGRINVFLNGPWSDPQGKGYQTIQSLYAIGSGGLFGKGLGYSMQKNGFIPEAHNDIIFSVICEELGLFGAIALILLFILLIWRCMVIASKAKNIQGMLIVTGVMVQIGIQVVINIMVVTNSMPNTGMPLPFISYGGSSLLFLMLEMGLVLNVARQSKIN